MLPGETKMKDEMISAEQGVKLYAEVGLSENTFYRHAREGKIHKTIDEDRQRGAMYSLSDIRKVTDIERTKRNKRVDIVRSVVEKQGKTDWVTASDLPRLLVLDYDMYGIEESVDLSITHHWWVKNPYMCRVLYNANDRKDIWGYLTLMPMKEEIIFKLLRREMHEKDIRPEHILTYDKPDEFVIYAASIVIQPEHRNHIRDMMNSVLNYWCSQYPKIKIAKIYAYADSDEGWGLIKHLFFAPRYDIGDKAFELNPNQLNPSKVIQTFQDCLKEHTESPEQTVVQSN